eukprot:EG_transcript_40957
MPTLQISNISCENLLADDYGRNVIRGEQPTSDPYVVFRVGDEEEKTRHIDRELNPKFPEVLLLHLPAGCGGWKLQVLVNDDDHASKSDPLGMYEMPLPSTTQSGSVTGRLTNQPKQKKTASGVVKFDYVFNYS